MYDATHSTRLCVQNWTSPASINLRMNVRTARERESRDGVSRLSPDILAYIFLSLPSILF